MPDLNLSPPLTFKALVLHQLPSFRARVETVSLSDIPQAGEVIVRVEWSCLNFKDALAVTNSGKIIRGAFPFVPGIDLAGTVESSEDPTFKPGDRVLSTGWGQGEKAWGGFSEIQRLRAAHLLPVPSGLTTRQAMIIGTAGLTAMLAVMEIDKGPLGRSGPILVTGATGGVGSFSVLALSTLGYEVAAVTGKSEAGPYLKKLGAKTILDRQEFSRGAQSALDSARWSGCIDSVGSSTLEAVISQTATHGTIAACGLAGGATLQTTVYPFILRGIRLIGIDSNTCPNPIRHDAWERLADLASEIDLSEMVSEVDLNGVPAAAAALMAGRVKGRYVVRIA